MATAPVTDINAAIVDRLGAIKAQIADLKKVEAELIARLIASGETAIDGTAYRATVSTTSDRLSPDPKAMEAKLRDMGVDGRWFAKNQKTTKGSTSVRVVARKA